MILNIYRIKLFNIQIAENVTYGM